ncbi:hypothetical protein T492DRAFT_896574 [Pavlovales sp. CCMP2436]|nr:hypothetical protein T492DRAFT_896574 [Pavlovales sp. CCMP2436]
MWSPVTLCPAAVLVAVTVPEVAAVAAVVVVVAAAAEVVVAVVLAVAAAEAKGPASAAAAVSVHASSAAGGGVGVVVALAVADVVVAAAAAGSRLGGLSGRTSLGAMAFGSTGSAARIARASVRPDGAVVLAFLADVLKPTALHLRPARGLSLSFILVLAVNPARLSTPFNFVWHAAQACPSSSLPVGAQARPAYLHARLVHARLVLKRLFFKRLKLV